MGALSGKQLKPKRSHTAGLGAAGTDIEEGEEWCRALYENDEYFIPLS